MKEMSKRQSIKIYDNLYSEELLINLYEVSKHILMPPSTFYVSYSDIKNQGVLKNLKTFFPKQFVDFLLVHLNHLIKKSEIKFKPEYGFEIWIGSSGMNSKTSGYLHVDNDEFYRTEHNEIKMPLLGSILYLTPNDVMTGGETLFVLGSKKDDVPTLFMEYSKDYLVSLSNTEIMEPKQGNFVVFNGDLAHAVLPYTLKNNLDPRINLLVNIWSKRISSVPHGITYLELI